MTAPATLGHCAWCQRRNRDVIQNEACGDGMAFFRIVPIYSDMPA